MTLIWLCVIMYSSARYNVSTSYSSLTEPYKMPTPWWAPDSFERMRAWIRVYWGTCSKFAAAAGWAEHMDVHKWKPEVCNGPYIILPQTQLALVIRHTKFLCTKVRKMQPIAFKVPHILHLASIQFKLSSSWLFVTSHHGLKGIGNILQKTRDSAHEDKKKAILGYKYIHSFAGIDRSQVCSCTPVTFAERNVEIRKSNGVSRFQSVENICNGRHRGHCSW